MIKSVKRNCSYDVEYISVEVYYCDYAKSLSHAQGTHTISILSVIHFHITCILSLSDCEDLISKMLVINADNRISTSDILRHKWFHKKPKESR
jgi:serine/threonine protein kinase